MSSSKNFIYSIVVESIGPGNAATGGSTFPGMTRFANRAWSGDSDSLYSKSMKGFPETIGFSINFRDNRATVGGQTVKLTRNDPNVLEVFTSRNYDRRFSLNTSIVSGTSMTIDYDNSDFAEEFAVGDVIGIGREAMRVTAINPHGSGSQAITVARGANKTRITPHKGTSNPAEGDSQVFLIYNASTGAYLPKIKYGRRFWVLKVAASATSYASEEIVWSGVLVDIDSTDSDTVTLKADSMLQYIEGITLNKNPFRCIYDDSASLSRPTFRSVVAGDRPKSVEFQSTSEFLLSLDGSVYKAREVSAQNGSNPAYTYVELVGDSPLWGSPEVDWEAIQDIEAFEIWCSDPETAPGSNAAEADLPISANPIKLVLNLLVTTDVFEGNGNYDMGIEALGAAISEDDIDLDTFERLAKQYQNITMPRTFIGLEGEGVNLLDFIVEILKPYNLILSIDSQGRLTLIEFRDVPTFASTTSLPEKVKDRVKYTSNLLMPFDQVTVAYSNRPGQKKHKVVIDDFIRRRRYPFGQKSTYEVDAGGMLSEYNARALAIKLIQRYNNPIPSIELETIRTLYNVWPGDLVKITNSKIFNKDGTRGITNLLGLVEFAEYNPKQDLTRLRILLVGEAYDRVGLIGPSAEATNWTSGTMTITVNTGTYSSSTDIINPDSSGFLTGDKIDILNEDFSVQHSNLEVSSTTSTTIVITTAPAIVTPCLVVPSTYDNVVSAQEDVWIWLADANEELGAANDDAFQYSF